VTTPQAKSAPAPFPIRHGLWVVVLLILAAPIVPFLDLNDQVADGRTPTGPRATCANALRLTPASRRLCLPADGGWAVATGDSPHAALVRDNGWGVRAVGHGISSATLLNSEVSCIREVGVVARSPEKHGTLAASRTLKIREELDGRASKVRFVVEQPASPAVRIVTDHATWRRLVADSTVDAELYELGKAVRGQVALDVRDRLAATVVAVYDDCPAAERARAAAAVRALVDGVTASDASCIDVTELEIGGKATSPVRIAASRVCIPAPAGAVHLDTTDERNPDSALAYAVFTPEGGEDSDGVVGMISPWVEPGVATDAVSDWDCEEGTATGDRATDAETSVCEIFSGWSAHVARRVVEVGNGKVSVYVWAHTDQSQKDAVALAKGIRTIEEAD